LADQSFQEKTEKPTARKESEARKEGQVAKSREVVSVSVLLAGVSGLCVFGAYMYHHIEIVMKRSFTMIEVPVLDLAAMLDLSKELVMSFMVIVLPMMASVLVVAVLSNLMQVGILFSWKANW